MRPAAAVLFVSAGAMLMAASLASAGEQEIFLPPDCDVLKITGKGFQLQLSQFEAVQKDFEEVEDESSRVGLPRAHGAAQPGSSDEDSSDEWAVVNENLFEATKQSEPQQLNYGPLGQELMRWISDRATSLLERVQRYCQEHAGSPPNAQIVLDILTLNTLVDLDNLNKEGVAELLWVRNKLNTILPRNVHQKEKQREVETFVLGLMKQNADIERKVRGTNRPGRVWVTNTQAIKRVLHEQRYSASLSQMIVEYMTSQFNLMKRSVVYEINRQPRPLDDGLYYPKARGHVPPEFPFPAQDAISHGFYN